TRMCRAGPHPDSDPHLALPAQGTLQEPEIERPEHQDNPDVCYQPPPGLVPEEQDVRTDNDGDQREHVQHDGCPSSHRPVLPCYRPPGQPGNLPSLSALEFRTKRTARGPKLMGRWQEPATLMAPLSPRRAPHQPAHATSYHF